MFRIRWTSILNPRRRRWRYVLRTTSTIRNSIQIKGNILKFQCLGLGEHGDGVYKEKILLRCFCLDVHSKSMDEKMMTCTWYKERRAPTEIQTIYMASILIILFQIITNNSTGAISTTKHYQYNQSGLFFQFQQSLPVYFWKSIFVVLDFVFFQKDWFVLTTA